MPMHEARTCLSEKPNKTGVPSDSCAEPYNYDHETDAICNISGEYGVVRRTPPNTAASPGSLVTGSYVQNCRPVSGNWVEGQKG
jgi:hypothetical protein